MDPRLVQLLLAFSVGVMFSTVVAMAQIRKLVIQGQLMTQGQCVKALIEVTGDANHR